MKVLKEIGKGFVGFVEVFAIFLAAVWIDDLIGLNVVGGLLGHAVIQLIAVVCFTLTMIAMKSKMTTVILTEAAICLVPYLLGVEISSLLTMYMLLGILPFTACYVPESEYNEAIYKLECLLCHATNGKLSKASYSLDTMERAVNDAVVEELDGLEANIRKDLSEDLFMEIDELLKGMFIKDGENLIVLDYDEYIKLKKKYTEVSENA